MEIRTPLGLQLTQGSPLLRLLFNGTLFLEMPWPRARKCRDHLLVVLGFVVTLIWAECRAAEACGSSRDLPRLPIRLVDSGRFPALQRRAGALDPAAAPPLHLPCSGASFARRGELQVRLVRARAEKGEGCGKQPGRRGRVRIVEEGLPGLRQTCYLRKGC